MTVTIRLIAEETGVSVSSVSRVLNGQKGVSRTKRSAVLSSIEKHGYCPNAVARGLVKKHTGNIGLVIPDISNPFFPEIARGVEKAAREKGYNLILSNSRRNPLEEGKCVNALTENRVDGIIIEPCSFQHLGVLKRIPLPMVYINVSFSGEGETCIGIDNVKAGEMATAFLIQRGYQRIAFAGGTEDSNPNRDRYLGYENALRMMGKPLTKGHVVHGAFEVRSGYAMAERLLSGTQRPDGIVAANDLIALGIIAYAKEHHVLIPEALGVIGCDDIYTSRLPQVALTTVAIPKEEMGRSAFALLFNQIQEGERSGHQHQLEAQLIVRGTTR